MTDNKRRRYQTIKLDTNTQINFGMSQGIIGILTSPNSPTSFYEVVSAGEDNKDKQKKIIPKSLIILVVIVSILALLVTFISSLTNNNYVKSDCL